jgi:hypothetical protein
MKSLRRGGRTFVLSITLYVLLLLLSESQREEGVGEIGRRF